MPSQNNMRRVVLESPHRGSWWARLRNRRYARRCLKDCLARGESPIASHILLPQVLNDNKATERLQGIKAGHAWIPQADAVVVYCDLGRPTAGMMMGIKAAREAGIPVEQRFLDSTLARETDWE